MSRQNPAYRPGGSRRRVACVAVLLGAGCAPAVPRQPIVPQAVGPVAAPITAPATRWAIVASSDLHRYTIEQTAVIATSAGGASSKDSVSLTLDVIATTPPAAIRGVLRTASVSQGGAPGVPFSGLALPLQFAAPGVARGGQVGLPARTSSPCLTPSIAALAPLRDALLRLPDTIVVGQAWSDSGSYETCRDGAPLLVSTRRSFVVLGVDTRPRGSVLLVSRNSASTLSGMTFRGADTTRVEGSGTGTMRYELDAASGAVVTATGTGTLDVTIRGRSKSESAHQELRSRITLQPD